MCRLSSLQRLKCTSMIEKGPQVCPLSRYYSVYSESVCVLIGNIDNTQMFL